MVKSVLSYSPYNTSLLNGLSYGGKLGVKNRQGVGDEKLGQKEKKSCVTMLQSFQGLGGGGVTEEKGYS